MAIQWERREQMWLVQWFKLKFKDVLIAASANGGARNPREAANMKKEGVLAGMPDLQIMRACRGYHGLFIEMKAPANAECVKGKVSMLQKTRIAKLNAEGYYAIVCWGWLEAKAVIEWYFGEYDASNE